MGQQQSQDIGEMPKLKPGGRRRGRRNMGQKMSSFVRSNSSRFNVHGDDEVEHLDEKIKIYKKELERLVAFGEAKQQEHHAELGKMDNELYRKRVELHRLGESAKVFFTFWDYVKIVQRATPTVWSPETMTFIESESDTSESSYTTDDLTPVPPSPKAPRGKSPRTRTKKSPGRPKRKESLRKKRQFSRKEEKRGMIISRSSTDMTFTIFGFFEAYLLRRLHLALLLKNQSTMQRHRWNDIIVYCYDEIPATKRDTEQAKAWLDYLKTVTPNYKKQLKETFEHFLALQDKLMYQLRAPEDRPKELEAQNAFHTIEEAPLDDEITRTLPTITQTSSGTIDFEDQDDAPTSAFSYKIPAEEAALPSAPPPQVEGRIYATSEFNTGTTGMTPEVRSRKSKTKPRKRKSGNLKVSAHNRVFESKSGSSDSGSDFGSSDDDLGDNSGKEKEKAAKNNDVKEKDTGKRRSKWSMSWKVPALDSDSDHASGDELKMSADNSAVGNEYGRLSMRDDDDNDDDRFDFVSQEANQQPMASSALAGGASMMLMQKSIRAQQTQSKPDSQQHFQLNTAGSDDAVDA
ncbi:unnamed protein product [Cylindrotheca closterium]|uniref:Uncharacterized protein n=1 Tax=Cylindrotheca closterium TaxID=2856 RepID=A0AAD2G9D4_9STRA|nr:unnamed protein product [Cylindrotheca closterium]